VYLLSYGLDGPGSNPGKGKKFFFFSKMSRSAMGLPRILFYGYLGSFPGVKRPRSETNHSPPTVWSHISAIYAFMA
jgi:hypothetical protein